MAMFSARGLSNFISELRSCTNPEDEQRRIDIELSKIRQKFTQNQALSSYDKKKYAWKLIYIYMLGYEIDFGHMQVVNLVAGTKYSEKCLGYLGCSILLKSSDELMTLVVNSIRNDLKSPEACNQCLALCCVANLGGSEFSEALSPDVVRLFMSPSGIAHVRKKAALCTRRMLVANPELIPLDELEKRLHTLLMESHLGVVTSSSALLQTALTCHPTAFRALIDVCINRLNALVTHKSCPRDYLYYNIPCPWLQVKFLKLLQMFGTIDDPNQNEKLTETLKRILSRPSPGKGAKNNANYAVLIETVNLIVSQGKKSDPKLKDQAVQLLARFISVSEPNIRYIGLDSMYRLVRLEGDAEAVKQHKNTVLFSLKDADNSVRRRALDLLFSMCDSDNALEIVGELVTYLAIAEGPIREEIVLKAAILAEKYAKNLRWYVDTVLQLITIAGSEVPDDVWHRVVQIVTNKEELQKYAAEVMFRALEPKHVDDTTAKFGAYVLGEFGYLICDSPDMSADKQFDVLYKHFLIANIPTKCLLLTAFVKMENLYEEIRPRVLEVFKKTVTNLDLEIQQRACEYLSLRQVGDETMKRVLEPMPVFPDNRESALLVRLRNQQRGQSEEEKAKNASATSDNRDDQDHEELPAAPVKHSKAPATGGNDDLLSLDDPVPGSSNFGGGNESIRGARPVSDVLDTFGLGTPPAAFVGGGGVTGIEASLQPKLNAWLKAIAVTGHGVLFENDLVQIGVKQEFRGSQGRLQLFYGNKTSESLTNFRTILEPAVANSFRFQAEEMATQVAARQQLKQQVMIESMAPFVNPPVFKVLFTKSTTGANFCYVLTLPTPITCFLEPVKLGAEDFVKRWNALEGQDREQQEVFNTSDKIDLIQTKKLLTENLHLAITEGMTDAALSMAATFRTGATGPTGDKLSVGCLVKVEANAMSNSFRVIVRALHRDVSLSLKNSLKLALA